MKKLLILALTACLLVSCLCAAGAEGTRAFVDSTGRTVELPETFERIAVSGPLAQIVVFALAPDMLVGIATDWSAEAEQYLPTEYYSLPVLGQLYGTKGALNLEELLAADPQVVIDVGEPKDGIAEDLDALSEQTGIPFVHVTARLSTLDETYTMLGELLGRPEEGAVLAAYCRGVYDRAVDIAQSVEKVDLLYITGSEGLNVIARDSYHSEVIDLMSNNLAVVESPSSKGTGNEVDMEQLLSWDPAYILFAPGSIYDTVAKDATWQNLQAIASGAYSEVPEGPDNWMGFPPSAQRLLGLMWMGKLLYPEAADYDLYTETAQYYDLFYHCELTQEQFDALTARSAL